MCLKLEKIVPHANCGIPQFCRCDVVRIQIFLSRLILLARENRIGLNFLSRENGTGLNFLAGDNRIR